jgi:metallo-beta-lactamase family protein
LARFLDTYTAIILYAAAMEIEFVGAAQCVTGSKHIVRTQHANVLLDCGLVQGRRRESIAANQTLGVDPRELHAVILSHAHIDHSGALPLLVKNGFEGVIYATPATRDLCAAMLADAANVQAQDARAINRMIERDQVDMDPVEPLYSAEDVVRVLERMVSIPYHQRQMIAPGVHVTFHDAGHVLGSAITLLDVEEGGKKRRLAFTGDLGRNRMPILRDPEFVSDVDVLITESTYGDRLHRPMEEMENDLEAVLKRTYARGGKLIVPSFALERAQEVIYVLRQLKKQGRMPPMPTYVDSPLTVKITDVFKLHPECYDQETRALITNDESPFDFDDLRYISEKEDSQALSANSDPAIIISASGMCEAGRVLHHLRGTIENEKNTIMIVGFQAQHTLGRRLVEKRNRVKVFGVERDLRAEVVVMNGFSAHADQKDLIGYAEQTKAKGPLKNIMIVHGETPAMNVLSAKVAHLATPHMPKRGDRFVVP